MVISKQTGEEIELELRVHAETGKAWLLSDDGEEPSAKWVPKSQCERGERTGNSIYKFTMAEWVATKQGWT